jgi:hypothetical protein
MLTFDVSGKFLSGSGASDFTLNPIVVSVAANSNVMIYFIV